eukprot:jgi/Chlat1/6724/Chrsp50S06433
MSGLASTRSSPGGWQNARRRWDLESEDEEESDVDVETNAESSVHSPAGSAQEPAAAPAAEDEMFIIHNVTPYDTLAGLAIKYNVQVADIKRANGLESDISMFAHKTLRIPMQVIPPGHVTLARPPARRKYSHVPTPDSQLGMLRGYYASPETPKRRSESPADFLNFTEAPGNRRHSAGSIALSTFSDDSERDSEASEDQVRRRRGADESAPGNSFDTAKKWASAGYSWLMRSEMAGHIAQQSPPSASLNGLGPGASYDAGENSRAMRPSNSTGNALLGLMSSSSASSNGGSGGVASVTKSPGATQSGITASGLAFKKSLLSALRRSSSTPEMLSPSGVSKLFNLDGWKKEPKQKKWKD